jgi:hypothetical protein
LTTFRAVAVSPDLLVTLDIALGAHVRKLFKALGRLAIGFCLTAAILVLAMFAGFFGGPSNSSGLFELTWISLLGSIVWAILAVFEKGSTNSKSSSDAM